MLYIREVPVVEEDTNKSALGALLRTLRINSGFASKVTWTQSVQGAVATGQTMESRMLGNIAG